VIAGWALEKRSIYYKIWYQIFSGKHRFSLFAADRPQCWQKYCAFWIRLLYCSCVMFFRSSQRCRSCPSWGTFSAASDRNNFPESSNLIASFRNRALYGLLQTENCPRPQKRSFLGTTSGINPTLLTPIGPCAIFWNLYFYINTLKNWKSISENSTHQQGPTGASTRGEVFLPHGWNSAFQHVRTSKIFVTLF